MSTGRYAVHPSVEHARRILRKLEERSGRTLAEWTAIADTSAYGEARALRDWLRREHGLSALQASLVADAALGHHETSDAIAYLHAAEGWVAAMYGGARAVLRPIHDRLVEAALALGKDVRVSPCRTIVPLYRTHVFAQITPATRTRVDLALALGDALPGARLESLRRRDGDDRLTHRVRLGAVSEVDAEVVGWLRAAYDRDGPG